jgi:hypothetical protein
VRVDIEDVSNAKLFKAQTPTVQKEAVLAAHSPAVRGNWVWPQKFYVI